MLSGFRAHIAAQYNGAAQNVPPTWPITYTPVNFQHLRFDTSNRFDCLTRRWTPVQAGEAPRTVLCGAHVLINGGASPTAVLVNVKMSQLRNGNEILSYAGQGEPDYSKPGMAKGQTTGAFLCEPGDEIGVWIMINYAAAAPVFPSPYGLGTLAVDPHWAHTYFWGVDDVPDTSLTARVAALEVADAAFSSEVTAALAALASSLAAVNASLTADLDALATDHAALAARVATLEIVPAESGYGSGGYGTAPYGTERP